VPDKAGGKGGRQKKLPGPLDRGENPEKESRRGIDMFLIGKGTGEKKEKDWRISSIGCPREREKRKRGEGGGVAAFSRH